MDKIFYDIFHPLPRQGPGSTEATHRALSHVRFTGSHPVVVDIGCGTGAQTLDLVKQIDGTIIAVDNYQPFLDALRSRAMAVGLSSRVETRCMDMRVLDFAPASFDLAWAEGSIYIIGFKRGLEIARPLLKDSGTAVFSDMNWLRPNPPREALDLFSIECPEMMDVGTNIELIGRAGYQMVHHFPLRIEEHWESYYAPLEQRVRTMLAEYRNDNVTLELLNSLQREVDVYRRCSAYFGYTFYVMKKS
jgi:SAM-dependent methyltransferase